MKKTILVVALLVGGALLYAQTVTGYVPTFLKSAVAMGSCRPGDFIVRTDADGFELCGIAGVPVPFTTGAAITTTLATFVADEVKLDPGVVVKPTCAVGVRGKLWYVPGATMVADTAEICLKDDANMYAWTSIFVAP